MQISARRARGACLALGLLEVAVLELLTYESGVLGNKAEKSTYA